MFSRIFRSFSSTDYYKILGLSKTASKTEIRSAYLRLAKQYHPDSPTGNEEKFKELGEAWSVLGNESSKSAYDSAGPSDYSNQGFHSGNPNYRNRYSEGYYRKNEHEKWQEFYRQQYEGKSSFQKEFEEFFEKNTENSRKTQKKRTKYYEFYDPRTGRRYFYSFTSTESNPDTDSQKQKIYENIFTKRQSQFRSREDQEDQKILRNYSIASFAFAFFIVFTLISRLLFPKRNYDDYSQHYDHHMPRQRVWDEFEDEFKNRFKRKD